MAHVGDHDIGAGRRRARRRGIDPGRGAAPVTRATVRRAHPWLLSLRVLRRRASARNVDEHGTPFAADNPPSGQLSRLMRLDRLNQPVNAESGSTARVPGRQCQRTGWSIIEPNLRSQYSRLISRCLRINDSARRGLPSTDRLDDVLVGVEHLALDLADAHDLGEQDRRDPVVARAGTGTWPGCRPGGRSRRGTRRWRPCTRARRRARSTLPGRWRPAARRCARGCASARRSRRSAAS